MVLFITVSVENVPPSYTQLHQQMITTISYTEIQARIHAYIIS